MWAAAEGHAEVVDRLVQAGADPARTLDSGLTAMMFAAREGRPAVVERLLKAGVDINAVTDPERNPRGRDPRRGTSALMLAVENGHFELALKLIDAGADPNDQRSGYSPLHAMSWTRKANRGEGIDGDPIPRVSGSVSSLEFVRELIARGADVNLRLKRGRGGGKAKLNPRGATPFLLASKTADLPLLRLLVQLGADPLIPNADGCTPIMAAAGIGVTAVGEEAGTEPEVLRTVRFLAERGADLNTVDDNGETVMHGAAYRSYPAVADLLTELGADPHVWYRENRHGWTPHRIAQGYRPGSFKPSPEMIAAIERALRGAGIEPPAPDNGPDDAEEERWDKPNKR
jgi:ankyrin repeat protein